MSEMHDALANLPHQMNAYIEVRNLARDGNFKEALAKVQELLISRSTRTHLTRILGSNEQYVIDRTFDEMDGRIAQALCWGCWKE